MNSMNFLLLRRPFQNLRLSINRENSGVASYENSCQLRNFQHLCLKGDSLVLFLISKVHTSEEGAPIPWVIWLPLFFNRLRRYFFFKNLFLTFWFNLSKKRSVGIAPKEKQGRRCDFAASTSWCVVAQVGTKYQTIQLNMAFPLSFLEPLLRMSVAPNPDMRLLVHKILHTLLDRKQNLSKLLVPS